MIKHCLRSSSRQSNKDIEALVDLDLELKQQLLNFMILARSPNESNSLYASRLKQEINHLKEKSREWCDLLDYQSEQAYSDSWHAKRATHGEKREERSQPFHDQYMEDLKQCYKANAEWWKKVKSAGKVQKAATQS
ncbi:MAG: hypothetical protein Q9221_003092 [Calogaya cf. arnoldii]